MVLAIIFRLQLRSWKFPSLHHEWMLIEYRNDIHHSGVDKNGSNPVQSLSKDSRLNYSLSSHPPQFKVVAPVLSDNEGTQLYGAQQSPRDQKISPLTGDPHLPQGSYRISSITTTHPHFYRFIFSLSDLLVFSLNLLKPERFQTISTSGKNQKRK